MESLRDGVWYPEMVLKDLITAGLSPKTIGSDIIDTSGKRFYYFDEEGKKPFAVVAWKKDDYMILAFAKEIPEEPIKQIVKAFRKVVEYPPFVRYDSFQRGEYFKVFEWAKNDEDDKFITIMTLADIKNVTKVKDEYYNA